MMMQHLQKQNINNIERYKFVVYIASEYIKSENKIKSLYIYLLCTYIIFKSISHSLSLHINLILNFSPYNTYIFSPYKTYTYNS